MRAIGAAFLYLDIRDFSLLGLLMIRVIRIWVEASYIEILLSCNMCCGIISSTFTEDYLIIFSLLACDLAYLRFI